MQDHINSSAIQSNNNYLIQFSNALDPFFVRKIPTWKRTMDIIGSLMALILLLPLFILIPILIKIVSPGPVMFRQVRIGLGGRPFTMLKFRTMKINADNSNHQRHICNLLCSDNPMKKLDNDLQIIPFGRILRSAYLDELPQLINVLKGEMSLVGPRPDVLYATENYYIWYNARFNSIPGLTGLWQVSGKNRTTYQEMMRLDINYGRQMSFWIDLKILLLTIPTIILEIKDDYSENITAGLRKILQ